MGLLLVAGLAHAQDGAPAPDAGVQAEIERLQRELDRLRERVGAPPPDPPGGEEQASEEAGEGDGGSWTDEVRVGRFYIETTDEDYRLELRVRLHVDFRFTDRGVDDYQNSAEVRRGRLELVGWLFGKDRLSYKLGFEFGRTGDADARDLYIELRVVDEARVRVGQTLYPFSTERLTSSNWMLHPERPIIVAQTVNQRDIGALFHGEVAERLRWFVGAFNGAGENVRLDVDDDFDLAGRIEVQPLEELLLAASYIYTPTDRRDGNTGPMDVFTVGGELTRFIDYAAGNRHRGRRERAEAGARLRLEHVELKGEVILDYYREVVSATGVEANLLTVGWFVDLAYVVLGRRDEGKVEPDAPLFDPETDALGPGAFDFAVRYEDWDTERRVLTDGFATGTDRVRALTGTVHWYLWTHSRISASYTASLFEDAVTDSRGRSGHSDHTIIVRWTLWF